MTEGLSHSPRESRGPFGLFRGEWKGGDFYHRLDVPPVLCGLCPSSVPSPFPSSAPSSSHLPFLPPHQNPPALTHHYLTGSRQSGFQKGSSVLTNSRGQGGGRVAKGGGWWVRQSGDTAVASVPERALHGPSAWPCVALPGLCSKSHSHGGCPRPSAGLFLLECGGHRIGVMCRRG